MARPFTLILLIAAKAILSAGAPGVDPAEVRRGFALVGPRTSDEPALRLERQTRDPSPSFQLGAALGAWISAAAALDYDLKTPSGDGGDEEAIGIDCYDERVAFSHLEARRQTLGMAPSQAIAAAGVEPGVLPAWIGRQQTGAPMRCR